MISSKFTSNIYLQSTATFYAASRLAGATPPPAHVVSRSIGLQVLHPTSDSAVVFSFEHNVSANLAL